jgi:thiol-disulfide isomerase/thioredoxin
MGTIEPPPGFPPPPSNGPAPAARTGASPWRLALVVLAGLAILLWLRRPSYLPDLPLAATTAEGTPSGEPGERLSCGGANGCLVVYVAPWCGPCNASLPGDVALAEHLAEKGWETHFVVGMDREKACLEMARRLGRPARLDLDGRWAKAANVRGVPHFLVTTPSGKIVKRQAGAYLAPPAEAARLLGIS